MLYIYILQAQTEVSSEVTYIIFSDLTKTWLDIIHYTIVVTGWVVLIMAGKLIFMFKISGVPL